MSDTNQNDNENEKQRPSELVLGTVTFIIFIIFMTVWMYFGSAD